MSDQHDAVGFHAYIGPKHVSQDSTLAYGKWDWALAMGPTPQPLPHTALRTLAATVNASSTSMSYTGAALPSAAGVWVGPNGTGQGWEYVSYYSNLTQCQRQVPPGQSGVHSAGAPIYLWYPLRNNNGQVTFDYEVSDNLAVIVWSAKLSGVQAPASILKPEHLIAVTYTLGLGAAETTYNWLFVGLIEQVRLSQDGQLSGTWEVEIVCTSRILQDSIVPGCRIGALDIALEAQASACSTLGANWKLNLPQQEYVNQGLLPEVDILDLQEDCGPQHMVDGNETSLWVSDGWRAPSAWFDNHIKHQGWCSIFCYPPPNAVFGSRYLEIIHQHASNFIGYYVYHKYTTSPGVWKACFLHACADDFFEENGVDTEALDGDEDRIVLCENGDIFKQIFPSAKPKFLFDSSANDDAINREQVRRLWWEGGAIFMAMSAPHGSHSLVYWGDCTYQEVEDAWGAWGTPDYDLPLENTACYLPTTGIKAGMVFRRDLTVPLGETSFVMDYFHRPGYRIGTETSGEFPEWLKITLPEMSHLLKDDIGPSTTVISIIDGQGMPNVEGLNLHGQPGKIYIDEELISFTSKDYAGGTLSGCTVTQSHKAGSKVYAQWLTAYWGRSNGGLITPKYTGYQLPFDGKLFATASAAYPLERMEWGRGKYANGQPRSPYICNYFWRFSGYGDARDASVRNHEEDYANQIIVDAASPTYSYLAAPNCSLDLTQQPFASAGEGFRPRTLLMEIRELRDLGGNIVADRPRLNYVRCFVDRRYFNPATWLDIDDYTQGMANQLVMLEILELAGQFPSFFSIYGPPHVGIRHEARARGMTERDSAWRVVTDMAEYGNSMVWCMPQGRVRVMPNIYLMVEDHPPQRTYTTPDLDTVEIVNVRPMAVGQVRLQWENGLDETKGVVYYPEQDIRPGSPSIEIGPLLADDEAMAKLLAENFYRIKRYPYNVFVELAQSDLSIEVCEVHEITYDFLRNGQLLTKLLLVETVGQEMRAGALRTVIGYREISQESL